MFLWVVSRASPGLIARIGRWKAIRAADRARASTPAYREFLDDHGVGDHQIVTLDLPPIHKNYIRAFPISDRCAGGSLPLRDVAIDESSGSSGVPYNWVRSIEKRAVSHITISHFARYDFGPGPWITINAFSMGAWATGINMGVALQRNGIVKSTGPDLEKIFSTLEFSGTELPYLVCGYPPFLKYMIDEAEARGFPLANYKLMGLYSVARGCRRACGSTSIETSTRFSVAMAQPTSRSALPAKRLWQSPFASNVGRTQAFERRCSDTIPAFPWSSSTTH